MLTPKRIARALQRLSTLTRRLDRVQEALGRIEMRQVAAQSVGIEQSEFRVFSQWGEDGIIQYLVRTVDVGKRIFIEFGVENYTESNTRFLLLNDHWSGLVIDASAENIQYIKRDPIYWASNLKAEQCFVTRENINDVLRRNGLRGDIGLLSIDIDGNDYWVWQAIDAVSPRIVICEYNGNFGPAAEVTIPYDPEFSRGRAHFSGIYYGASIAALQSLGASKGYSLVGVNSAGNNLFFVRNDVIGSLRVLSAAQAYRRPQFREFHDESGHLTFDDLETRLRKIRELPLHDLGTDRVRRLADVEGIEVNDQSQVGP